MIFSVDSKTLQNALDKIQVKGKHLTNNGFSSSSIGSDFWAELEGNTLKLWNGDATFIVNINVEVEGTKDGNFIASAKEMIPFLKSFDGTVNVNVGDMINLGQESKSASLSKIAIHSGFEAISRVRTMLTSVRYEPSPETLFAFNKKPFEGAFTLNQEQFKNVLKSCELANTGIYKLDYKENIVGFSSGSNTSNKYNESITPTFNLGEDGTLEFSGPLYAFFDKEQLLNFYVKDEFPLLVVASDRMLLKAPTVNE